MELFPEHYFSDYSLEGVTKEENQILMEVKADEMAKNLTQLKSSGSAAPKALKVNAWFISNVQGATYFIICSVWINLSKQLIKAKSGCFING